MFTTRVSRISGAVALLGAALVALPCNAQTPTGIKLMDNAGNIITITSSGAVAYSGACTASTCSTTASTGILSTLGQITWAGTIGSFTFTATGQTAPLRPGIQDINLSALFTGATGGTLTAQFTVTSSDGAPPFNLTQTSNFLVGAGSVMYTGFADATNTPFGTGTTLGSIGPVTASGASTLQNLPGPDSHDLSITDQEVLTLGPNSVFTSDFYTGNSINTPLLVSCAPGSAVAGSTYSGSLTASGGVPSFVYSIVGNLPPGLILNSTTGAITGKPTAQGSYSYTAEVTDSSGSSSSVSSTAGCSITVAPPSTPLTLACSANTGQVGTPYNANLLASGGTGSGYVYSIASGSLPAGLGLNSTTGYITGTPTAAGPANYTAQVSDTGDTTETPVTNSCGITITGAPTATCAVITSVQGTAITPATLTATGGSGSGYTFTATGLPSGLTISSSGTIWGTPTVSGTFPYTVTIKDSAGNTGTISCSITVSTPPVDLACGTTGAANLTVGTVYASQLAASSGTPGYTYSLASGSLPPGLTLNPSTGAVSGTPTTSGTYTFTTKVTDAKGNTATASCTVIVVAPAPTLACGTCGENKTTVGATYLANFAVTSGSAPFTYTVISGSLPPGLSLNGSTGTLSGSPTTVGTYTFTTKVVDANGNSDTVTCSISVQPSPITMACGSCGSASTSTGANYSATLSAKGGTAPYTYSIVSGALPPGLSLNSSTGVISGTPTTGGTYTFTSKVVDANGSTDSASCTIVVQAPPVNLLCGGCGGSGGGSGGNSAKVGATYSGTLSVSGGHSPFTYSILSGSLPPGLTLNATTGVISGSPTTAGTYTFTSKVVDANGSTDTATCTITITGQTINLNCGSCGQGKGSVGASYSSQLSVTSTSNNNNNNYGYGYGNYGYGYGNGSSYTYSIVSGSLPPGLSLNTSSGVISGTPTTPGTYTFTSKVVDSYGDTDTTTCSIVVTGQPISLQCGSCGSSNASAGSSYTSQLSVTGGSGSGYTYSIASGTLPPGLTLNASTGLISGTPTTGGSYSFTSKVVDSKGNTDTTTCTIVVASSPLDLECGSCGNNKATAGTAYTSQLSVKGGSGTYTFSIVSGSLPPGLTLNTTTGLISGTPTTAGTYTFTSKAVDANGKSDTATCTVVVAGPPVSVDCSSFAASKPPAGSPYSGYFKATGGAGGYNYSVPSGSLPPGLTLNPSTGQVSGTPSKSGTWTFTVKVTDSNGSSDSNTCGIVVTSPPVNITGCGTCTTGNGHQGVAFSATLPMTGGTGPFVFSVSSGSLPPGLTLNTSTGAISGTPTKVGSWTFTIKVVDANGASDTQTCTMNVDNEWWW